MTDAAVVWHDLECGDHRADLPLWHELAQAHPGRLLDVGAGTGRVALALARAGHDVVALELDPRLLRALRERAAGLPVESVAGDACDFALPGRRFGLIVVAMQTIQLLDERGRAGLLRCARAPARARRRPRLRDRRRPRAVVVAAVGPAARQQRDDRRRRVPQPAGRGARRRRPG